MGTPHIRAGSGGERGVDPVKIENIGGVAGRQAGGPPGQGYSKYQKSLPPRFQRQQQVRILFYFIYFIPFLGFCYRRKYSKESYVLLQVLAFLYSYVSYYCS